MDEKRKRRYNTFPEVYMNGQGESCFFRPHYPVEDSELEAIANPEEDSEFYPAPRDMQG